MPGLVPGIHVFALALTLPPFAGEGREAGMAGTSPAMTKAASE